MSDNTSTQAGETWTDMVRRVSQEYGLGSPSDDEADFVLWEKTAFPLAPADHVERQVREFMERATHTPCDHPPNVVWADLLVGGGLTAPTPLQVQWCSVCGAARLVFGNPHDGSELTYGQWETAELQTAR